jgi:hypothetical protein
VTHELGLRGPFQSLLDKAAKRRGWTLVPELSTYSGGKRVVPDGTVRDEFRLVRASLNPEFTDSNVDEMLIQHLLTERLMRNLFQNPEFTCRSVAAEFPYIPGM